LPYNNLYHRPGSQDSITDVSQIINKTKAAQAKSATMIIDGLNLRLNLIVILSVSLGKLAEWAVMPEV